MATVLDKSYTNRDSSSDIVKAIHKLATDDNQRVELDLEVEWLTTKMREIARLATILKQRKL